MIFKLISLYEIIAVVAIVVSFVVYLIVSRNEGSEDKLDAFFEEEEGGTE